MWPITAYEKVEEKCFSGFHLLSYLLQPFDIFLLCTSSFFQGKDSWLYAAIRSFFFYSFHLSVLTLDHVIPSRTGGIQYTYKNPTPSLNEPSFSGSNASQKKQFFGLLQNVYLSRIINNICLFISSSWTRQS